MRLIAYVIALVLAICVFIFAIRIINLDRKQNAKNQNSDEESTNKSHNKINLFGVEINSKSIGVILIVMALAIPIILLKFIDLESLHKEPIIDDKSGVKEIAQKRLNDLKAESLDIANKKEQYSSIVDYKTDSTFNEIQIKALEDSFAKNLFK